MQKKAGIIGLGLIGGSIGLALCEEGWDVIGRDINPTRVNDAKTMGAITSEGSMKNCEVVFVATPVADIAESIHQALQEGAKAVTDVGSVKGSIVHQVDDKRFIPGHPMAGSEQEGIKGARSDLFRGAAWVLTPPEGSDDLCFEIVQSTVIALGADVVVIDPDSHDKLVAVVSHVPHLAAGSLMRIADSHSQEHRSLLRLAAGGFRDMTRIAGGNTKIWPDICIDNSDAILSVIDEVIESLAETKSLISEQNKSSLLQAQELGQLQGQYPLARQLVG